MEEEGKPIEAALVFCHQETAAPLPLGLGGVK